MPNDPIVTVSNLTHRYGARTALDGVSFEVPRGSIFALLGPNGGGKTTLFKILATVMRPSAGSATIAGADVTTDPMGARRELGVVFQQPSLDGKLTVSENIHYQGNLYGLSGAKLRRQADEWMDRCKIRDRADDRVDTLSGGLQRRVELAKAMLHRPNVLLLDEPSTGLDPGARMDLMAHLRRLSGSVTTLLTTHLLEEADACDTVGVLHQGKLIAMDTPDNLKKMVGSEVLTIDTGKPNELAAKVAQRFRLSVEASTHSVRIEHDLAHEFVPKLIEAFPGAIDSVRVGRPTLDDVFLSLTGHRLADGVEPSPKGASS